MIKRGFSFIFDHNWIAILYFNFRMLPFKQAIKLPFDFYHSIKFENLGGQVAISSTSPLKRGMIKIGAQGSDMFNRECTSLDLRGNLLVGNAVTIGTGTVIRIEENGSLEIGNSVAIGARSMLFCENSMIIKEGTITSWNCQMMDTDTHSIEDVNSLEVYPRSKPIFIGKRCWIGNHVLINKGTVFPDDLIVASNSLCNKDYSKTISPFSIIGGIPAGLISENKRIFGDKINKNA